MGHIRKGEERAEKDPKCVPREGLIVLEREKARFLGYLSNRTYGGEGTHGRGLKEKGEIGKFWSQRKCAGYSQRRGQGGETPLPSSLKEAKRHAEQQVTTGSVDRLSRKNP